MRRRIYAALTACWIVVDLALDALNLTWAIESD